MAGILRDFQPAMKKMFLKIRKMCTTEKFKPEYQKQLNKR